jgi:hypothetical protein
MRMPRTKNPTLIGALSALALFICATAATAAQAAPIGAFTTKGAFSFVSAPRLHPPKLKTTMRTKTSQLAPGFFLVANFKNVGQNVPMVGQAGPLMLDHNLQPVWFQPIGVNALAANLRTQTLSDGQPGLSWWEGKITKTGQPETGKVVVVDQHYHKVGSVTGKKGWIISLHDAVVIGDKILVTAYEVEKKNLSKFHGARNGRLLDCAVQTYSLKTGALLSSWDAAEHIPLRESQQRAPKSAKEPWDAYHLNSIFPVGDGSQVIVSMRNTWAGYLVDLTSEKIAWTLGGKDSTFRIPKPAQFHWQHDIQIQSGNIVSVFDDNCCGMTPSGEFLNPNGPARGLVLRLNMSSHTASKVSQYKKGRKFYVAFLGNTDLLPNGNVTIGWGSNPFFSEFSRSGKLLFDAAWPTPDQSYRAYTEPWVGEPTTKPSIALRKGIVYASWNGATEVVRWRVLAGNSASSLKPVATKAKSGFETTFKPRHSAKAYEVEALDAQGKVLGTSKTVS